MSELELSITICSWNTKEDLFKCLESLQKVRDEAAFEVIVVDNNSADGSPNMVKADFRRLSMVQKKLLLLRSPQRLPL